MARHLILLNVTSDLRSSRWELRWSASFGELSPQRQTGAGRTRDKPLLFVDNLALDVSGRTCRRGQLLLWREASLSTPAAGN
jgi:hypothetical protein